jgi:hypothetical protein
MQYRFASVLAAGALVAMVNGAPIVRSQISSFLTTHTYARQSKPTEKDEQPTLGPVDSTVTWGKRDVIWGEAPAPAVPVNTIGLGKPTSDVHWDKREEKKEPNTIELGDATTVVSWGKRDDEPEKVDPTLGEPDSTIIWGRDVKEENKFTIGDATTVVSWNKREAEAGDAPKNEFTLGDVKTVIEWDKRDEGNKNVMENGQPTTDVTWS